MTKTIYSKTISSVRNINRKLSKKSPDKFTLQEIYIQGVVDAHMRLLSRNLPDEKLVQILADIESCKKAIV